jgi:hypothetical protein
MLSFLSGDLLTAIVRLLPRAFVFGAPIALSLLVVAAFVDVKVPHEVDVTSRR